MATMTISNTAMTTSTKRKRNQVSYADDDYFDSLDLEGVEEADDDGIEDDDDGSFGKKKRKGPAKKKAKLTLTKAKKPKEAKPFRFLDLPAELRDEIYDLALTEPDGITLCSRTKNYRRTVTRGAISVKDGDYYYGKRRRRGGFGYFRRRRSNPNSQDSQVDYRTRQLSPNLLAVNKQIRDEASSVLYKQEIILEDTTALQTFVAQIGDYNRKLVSDITIKGWGEGRGVHKGHNYAAFAQLAACPNIKSLFIDCSVDGTREPRSLARQLFRDGHFFFEAVGDAAGRYDAAVDILELDDDWHFDKNTSGRYRYSHSDSENRECDPEKKKQFQDELRSLLSR